jgi:LuxR family maltose regulon positive regulatory protein
VGKWFRYHHLFRDLLNHRLHSKYDQKDIKDLHRRASRWFEENDLIDEAISHAFMADDLDLAAQIVARRRFRLMNHARWQRLARYLSLFPPAYASQQPDLLMLKAWLIYHRGHYDQLPPALEQIAAAMESTPLPPESTRYLKGESSALASLLSYYSIDASRTFAEADFSIRNTPPESWIVRSLARMFLAGSYQMRGELNHAYSAIFQAADEEIVQHNRFKSTMLMTSCFIYWIAGDLNGLIQVANRCMELFDYHHSVEIEGYVHYHLGCAYYQQNDLAAAQEHFAAVVHQPHLNYGDCYAHSAFGLSLTYLAQNRQELARKEAQSAFAYLLETGNMTLLPIAQAFEAELALRLGRLAEAEQWATQFDLLPPLLAMIQLYQYHFTFIKIWLALDTPASRQQAADLLYQLRHYTESTHNRIFLIEVLALLAVLHLNDGDEKAALAALERSVRLAQPGGVIRIFVDLGPPLAHLLDLLQQQDVAPEYVRRIRIAFPEAPLDRESAISTHRQPTSEILVDNLTPREQEVLELLAKRLTNKEIAEELVVSLGTVKTHTLSIYTKLNVHGRRQAVNRARELDLVSTN